MAPGISRATHAGFDTWTLSDGPAQLSVVPARGGLISRFTVDGQPVLFIDESTLLDPTKNVRGGIPLLFPLAGRAPAGSPMSQHGFARNQAWTPLDAVSDSDTARLTLELQSNDATRAVFPFEFRAQLDVSLFESRLLLEFSVKNLSAGAMPMQFGLHPYFDVPLLSKAAARVETAATRAYDQKNGRDDVAVGPISFGAGEVDLHLKDHPGESTRLLRGPLPPISLSWTPNFPTLVLWTLPERPFICVEPWGTRQELAPNDTELFAFQVSVSTGPSTAQHGR